MILFAWLVLVSGLVAFVAAVGYLCLVPERGRRRLAVILISAVLLPLPLLIPDDPSLGPAPLVRFVAAILCVMTCGRLYDLHVGYAVHGRPPLGAYLAFLQPHAAHMVFRRIGSEPGPDREGNWRALRLGTLELVLGAAATYLVFTQVGPRGPFALEHAAKWLALYIVFDGGQRAVAATQRLLGRDALNLYDDPITAPTPAEFWRRYNRMVGEWLFNNVYRRRALRRRPFVACLSAFAASAALHEYVFGMALLRVNGFQTVFFLSHGLATAATARLDLEGWKAWAGVAVTIAFTLATLVLFTADVHDVLAPLGGFYARGRPPLWAG